MVQHFHNGSCLRGAYGDFWIETSLHHCGKRALLNFPCFVVVAHQDFRRLTTVFSDQLIIVLGEPHLVHTGKSGIIKVSKSVVKESLSSGAVIKTVNREKKLRHMKDERGYIAGRSYLNGSLDEIQELVDQLSGTGTPISSQDGAWQRKERVHADHDFGVYIDEETGKAYKTNNAIIVYSKSGTHIIPSRPKKEGGQMSLKPYINKKVKIVADNDVTFAGTVNDYFYPDENENGKESIILDTLEGQAIEFYENSIKAIEIIK